MGAQRACQDGNAMRQWRESKEPAWVALAQEGAKKQFAEAMAHRRDKQQATPMKQSTMRVRSVTLKREWLENAEFSERFAVFGQLQEMGLYCSAWSFIEPYGDVVYLPTRQT